MSGRGRGRGRGFGRGSPFSCSDQLNILPVEKVTSVQHLSPYPLLDHFPAALLTDTDYDELNAIQNQISSFFQSSNYYLKPEEENTGLFLTAEETTRAKKVPLNFDWDYFPFELRPVGKRKLKKDELLDSLRKNKMASIDLSWLDTLAEKEKSDVLLTEVVSEGPAKKDQEELDEAEEFDDEELDDGTDYNTNYFDNGEGYLDEEDDLDEGPCY